MSNRLLGGLDVGSTTVKLAVLDDGGNLIHHRYERHRAEQAHTALALLREARAAFGDDAVRVAACGSGGAAMAKALGAPFVQEVVANGVFIRRRLPDVRTAIELGGQDAKLLFLRRDAATGKTLVHDMRMNGSCAGGTGAFIDQIAELLKVPAESFEALAAGGETVYEISGRCGVFAKTDLQPLLNRGVARQDLALSAFHAIAKQTIGGLAQGMRIEPPVLFEGGPLTFNPTLVRVFLERLGLSPNEVLLPEHAEVVVACGAALAIDEVFLGQALVLDAAALDRLEAYVRTPPAPADDGGGKFFQDAAERQAFTRAHAAAKLVPYLERPEAEAGPLEVIIGIDAGSTTSKFVLTDTEGRLLDKYYSPNEGEPLQVVQRGLLQLHDRYAASGVELVVRGVGATGYGELLFAKALAADYHTVETVAHTRAAAAFLPGLSFVLDVGGQDMKAIFVRDGIPVNFVLNEACSAGCGSFLETYARSLGVAVTDIAELAFRADSPSRLGSRCTVFMNSSIITEQKNGRSLADIMAGLCRSVVENALTKVLRLPSFDALGSHVVVQGGTFKNDAVLRAFQQMTGREVHRPPHPGEMGAIGIALLTLEAVSKEGAAEPSRFIGWEALRRLTYEKLPAPECRLCSNSCRRTVVQFSGEGEGEARRLVTGNRCEKGEVLEGESGARERLRDIARREKSIPDLMALREKLLFRDYDCGPLAEPRGERIGIPRAFELWDSLPFWSTFFRALGFDVVTSPPSSADLLASALPNVSSDTICLPAKLVHGHMQQLFQAGVDRIFYPMMLRKPRQNRSTQSAWLCPIIQGYGEVARIHDKPQERGVAFDAPSFSWESWALRDRQVIEFTRRTYGVAPPVTQRAIALGDEAMTSFKRALEGKGREVLSALYGTPRFAAVLAGRPYHTDQFVNHDLAKHFSSLGIAVLDLDSLPGLDAVDLSDLLVDTNNVFHTRLLGAAKLVAEHPNLELVQIVSFGCGHDAILSDEVGHVMATHGSRDKVPLVLKLDEGDSRGPIGIRVKSFVETLERRRGVARSPS